MTQAPRRRRRPALTPEDRLDMERLRAMERGLEMRGGGRSGVDEYWQAPVNNLSPGIPDLSDPGYSIQRPNSFRLKKGGKVPATKKYQKGGKVAMKKGKK